MRTDFLPRIEKLCDEGAELEKDALLKKLRKLAKDMRDDNAAWSREVADYNALSNPSNYRCHGIGY